jgi:hypothetical protein
MIMQSLNEAIRAYTSQLRKGDIQKAYKGIMTFMTGLKTYLENKHMDFSASGLYFGYMDMTYFAFTPPELKQHSLKIAIVYLHEQNRFAAWLSGANRKVQAETIEMLKGKENLDFQLSEVSPGVDSIIEMQIVEKPDFDHPEELRQAIESKVIDFSESIKILIRF